MVPPKSVALSQWELITRQAALDAGWNNKLEADREQEEEWAASCHRGPGDADYQGRNRM
jgi:hypothetical protein